MIPENPLVSSLLDEQEMKKGNANRATLAVVRKLVAYLMALDRGQRNFQVMETTRRRATRALVVG